MGANLRPLIPQEISFARKQKNPLGAISKKLLREMEDAVDRLVELATNKNTADKIKLDANTSLIKFAQDIEESINNDEIRRKIAALKFPTGDIPLGDDNSPIVDFDSIQQIN